MKEKVGKYIQAHRIFSENRQVLVALSGGADSVALLLLLQELGYDIQALHCNFHLRAEESDRDERFVSQLCLQHNIPLLVRHFDTTGYAGQKGISIEMAARDLRYEWFYEVMAASQAQCIGVAHQMDDQAETLLLNLIRGTGIRGLAGMYPLRNGIARPLLCVTRKEILAYLNRKNQTYVTDSTILQRDAVRNKVRLDIMPLLADINPSIVNTLAETCSVMRSSIPFYEQGVQHAVEQAMNGDDRLNLRHIEDGQQAAVLIHEWLKNKGFSGTQTKEIVASLPGTSGKIWESKTFRLLKDRTWLILQEKGTKPAGVHIIQEQVESISETGPGIAYFDADKLRAPVTYRNTKEGDWFVPYGMRGRKLVSDYLTDIKASRFEKENQQVALCGDDIIWVVGHRSDNRYKVDKNTKHIIRLRTEKQEYTL